nr:unnamed protein product [Callosobruchus analis]CAI5862007.1 unnamed protein product [Callosobruchus analis]
MAVEGGSLLYLLSLTNESDDTIQNTLTWMYQLRICSRFNASEMREVEVFMNLLANHNNSLGSDTGYIRIDLPYLAGVC